jgi:hypothetical protein
MHKHISYKFDFSITALHSYAFAELKNFYNKGLHEFLSLKGISVTESENVWSIRSVEIFSYYLNETLEEFLAESMLDACKFIPKGEDIISCLFVKVQILEGSTMPGLHLGHPVINFLAANNAVIDVDIYDMRK